MDSSDEIFEEIASEIIKEEVDATASEFDLTMEIEFHRMNDVVIDVDIDVKRLLVPLLLIQRTILKNNEKEIRLVAYGSGQPKLEVKFSKRCFHSIAHCAQVIKLLLNYYEEIAFKGPDFNIDLFSGRDILRTGLYMFDERHKLTLKNISHKKKNFTMLSYEICKMLFDKKDYEQKLSEHYQRDFEEFIFRKAISKMLPFTRSSEFIREEDNDASWARNAYVYSLAKDKYLSLERDDILHHSNIMSSELQLLKRLKRENQFKSRGFIYEEIGMAQLLSKVFFFKNDICIVTCVWLHSKKTKKNGKRSNSEMGVQ